MRIKQIPSDFMVEEQLNLTLGQAGPYAIYRVEKRGITTHQVQMGMAATLNYRRSTINLPALKDRQSIAVQYASVKGNPPPRIQGQGWTAIHAGRLDRPLRPTDIAANRFVLTVRDLSDAGVAQLRQRLHQMADHGLPNYFDRQRFGSYSPGAAFIAARILARDAEGALRSYLSAPLRGDPAEVRRFKQVAADHWGEWGRLFAAAPAPSNYRSVLTYLRDHPQEYRKALNLIPRQLLSLYLSAYQSYLWNRIAGDYLRGVLSPATSGLEGMPRVRIAGAELPVYLTLPPDLLDRLRSQRISMPHHRAIYPDPAVAAAAEAALKAESLIPNDLKARILKKAYLSRHQRALLLHPSQVEVEEPVSDERFPGRDKLVVKFTLPRAGYATLVIRAAQINRVEQVRGR
jgi:tRNA pseudouridine13 synthase